MPAAGDRNGAPEAAAGNAEARLHLGVDPTSEAAGVPPNPVPGICEVDAVADLTSKATTRASISARDVLMSSRAVSTGSAREVDAAGAGLSPRPRALFPGAGWEEAPRFPLPFPARALREAEGAASPHSIKKENSSSLSHPLGGVTPLACRESRIAMDWPSLQGSRSLGQKRAASKGNVPLVAEIHGRCTSR